MRHALLLALQAVAFVATPSHALPRNFAGDNFGVDNSVFNASDYFSPNNAKGSELRPAKRQDGGGTRELRILPLGASIMSGVGSSDGAGYVDLDL